LFFELCIYFIFSLGFFISSTIALMATILCGGLLGNECLTTMVAKFRKFYCTAHQLLFVANCCCLVLLGALFRYLYIKLTIGHQNRTLGNNQATNISKKVQLGNKKEKENLCKTYEKQALDKQNKDNYFPIQNLLNIVPKISLSNSICPVILPRLCKAERKSILNKSPLLPCVIPSCTSCRLSIVFFISCR
jgi:hypothetical protein